MDKEFDEVWINYAVLCKIPISKIPKAREFIKEIGSFIYDKHSAYDIYLVIDKPKTNAPSGNSDGVDVEN